MSQRGEKVGDLIPGKPRHSRRQLHRAREGRRKLTPAELKLWAELRAGGLDGLKFTKQYIIGPYIADFAYRSGKLIVELDGDSHADRVEYAQRRSAFLNAKGYRVLRFQISAVHEDMEFVLESLRRALTVDPPPAPPCEQGGGL